MSGNPVAEQANAADAVNTNQSAVADPAQDDVFKTRTFDVFWVEKQSLMYRDGFAKVSLMETLSLKSSITRMLSDCQFLIFFECNTHRSFSDL